MTLRCKLEIVPYGVEEDAYEICRIDISSQGPVSPPECTLENYPVYNYTAKFYKNSDHYLCDIVENIHHVREDGALALVEEVLGMRHG